MKYIYDYDSSSKTIIFNHKLKKVDVRVVFSRELDTGIGYNKKHLPVATAFNVSGYSVDWFEGFDIFEITIKRKYLFGLISWWYKAEPVAPVSHHVAF